MSRLWYVIHAYSGFEKQVKQSLQEHIAISDLSDKFGEIMVPSEEVIELKDGKKSTSERRFFPGYVLINMEMSEETWHLVRHAPKVLGFVGGGSYPPTPIKQSDVDEILQRVQERENNPQPKITYRIGEMVRVLDGPFKDFEAVVESVHYDKNQIDVAVIIFGRSTKVTLDFSQIQKA